MDNNLETTKRLLEWIYQRNSDPDSLIRLRMDTVRRISARIVDGSIDKVDLSDTLYELAIILFDNNGERVVVEFCPCGHTAQWTIPMIIAAGGFRQLLDIYEGRRASAPTFPTSNDGEFVCRECESEFEHHMEKMAYMMSL